VEQLTFGDAPAVVRADLRSVSVAAASVIAKVHRDRWRHLKKHRPDIEGQLSLP